MMKFNWDILIKTGFIYYCIDKSLIIIDLIFFPLIIFLTDFFSELETKFFPPCRIVFPSEEKGARIDPWAKGDLLDARSRARLHRGSNERDS